MSILQNKHKNFSMETVTKAHIMSKSIYLAKLVLNNFQTYKTATFNFTPKLNFIAAPNGSGKSSITNAINFLCLGTPKTISKSCNLSEYIRFGEHVAHVEGHYKHHNITTVIRREIQFNSSKFFINDKLKTKRDVADFMKHNCIDVNNMTQFLPQEKVSEFAKMTSEELLDVVLQTLDDIEINILRNEVIENEKKLDEVLLKINYLNEMQLGNKKIVESLKEEVAKYEDLSLKRRRIELLQLKIFYLEYNEKLTDIKDANVSIERHEEIIKQNKAIIAEITEKIKGIENSPQNTVFKSHLQEFEARNSCLADFTEKIEKQIQECEILNVDISNLEKKKESRNKEIVTLTEKSKIYNEKLSKIKKINMTEIEKKLSEKLRVDVEKYEKSDVLSKDGFRLKTSRENDNNKSSGSEKEKNLNFEIYLSKIIDNLHEHKMNVMKEERAIQEKSLKSNMQFESLQKQKIEYGQTDQRKLNSLKNYNKHCYEGVCWLRKNQSLFKQEVMEPAFLHVDVKNMAYIKEIENCLSYNMLVTFLCQNESDFATFTKLVKDDQRLNVNVLILSEFNENIDSTKIKNLGLDGTVLDFIETRSEYVKLFCILGNVHKIPICKKKMDETILLNKHDFRKAIINERYLEVKKSRYNKNDSVTVDSELRRKNIFGNESTKKEVEEIDKMISEIKLSREEYSKKVKILFTKKQCIEEALNAFYNYKKDYSEKHSEMKEYSLLKVKLKKYIKENTDKIKEFSDSTAIDNEIAEYKKYIDRINADIKTCILQSEFKLKNEEFYNFYEKICYVQQTVERNLEEMGLYTEHLKVREDENKKSSNEIAATLTTINELKKERDVLKDKIKCEMSKLQSSEIGPTTTSKIFTELERLNPNKNKLKDEMISLKTELDFIKIDNLAIEDYKTRQFKLKNIDSEKESTEKDFERLNNDNNTKRVKLVELIINYVNLVDSRFSYFFKKINSEGQVDFENKDIRCNKWKLNIMVKFRKDEELAKLTGFRQSGGEKSVSTVLFLLALQNLSKSPFKLVDEINQGMDRINEKKINDLIIEICNEADAPQFFLITPKIVEGIKFSNKVKVFVIFNNVNEEASAGFNNYFASIN